MHYPLTKNVDFAGMLCNICTAREPRLPNAARRRRLTLVRGYSPDRA
jgi:hypothetical protein